MSLIKLAMELPTSKLEEWTKYADLDFILAHQVLEDKAYADFFRNRPADRELILDNSLHELGYPLSVADLREAAERCDATYVIAPDKVGNVEFNIAQFKLAYDAFRHTPHQLAVVMTADPELDAMPLAQSAAIENFLYEVRAADMLCCTFKLPRRYDYYTSSAMAKKWRRVHLLGVDTPEELQNWRNTFRDTYREASVDTAKPLKWAMQYERLSERRNWRKAKLHSADLLNLRSDQITTEQEQIFIENVETLRRYL